MYNTVKNAILNGVGKETKNGYFVICSNCGNGRILKTREMVRRACKFNRKCNSCSNGIKTLGRKSSLNTKLKMSKFQKERYTDINERNKTSKSVKLAMHRSEVRKKHISGLYHSKWIKVRTDKGQIEFIDKWNKLGFNFEPNYQIKTNDDLFYIDGYDKEKNVVIEYDSKYHFRLKQQQKDIRRQNKIIHIINPKRFWRYDSVNKTTKLVYRNN